MVKLLLWSALVLLVKAAGKARLMFFGRNVAMVNGLPYSFLRISLLLVICALPVYADTLQVDIDGSTGISSIQDAIDDANDGDVIIVAPGTYYENIRLGERPLVLTSEDPYDPNIVAATIIDGNQPSDPCEGATITVLPGADPNCVITGFTITG